MGSFIRAMLLTTALLIAAIYILVTRFAPGETPEEKVKSAKEELKKAKTMIRLVLAELPETPGGSGGAAPAQPAPSPETVAPPKEINVTVEAPPAPAIPPRAGDPQTPTQAAPRPASQTPSRAETATAEHQKFVEHVVEEGETLCTIAREYLGSSREWKRLAAANPKIDPDALSIGTIILIPCTTEDAKTDPERLETNAGGSLSKTAGGSEGIVEYTMEPGDTLYGIAERLLGDGERWREIMEANPGLDQDRIPVGRRIRIPRSSGRR